MTTSQHCLGGLCRNPPTFLVYAPVGGRYKEVAVCAEHVQSIRSTVYVRPIEGAVRPGR